MAPYVDGMGPEPDPVLDALQRVALASEDKIWRTSAMAQLTVRFPDGKFKKAAQAPGDPELLLSGVRAGKRHAYIFEFVPVDSRPFEAVEMSDEQAMKLLPGFLEHLLTGLGYGPEQYGASITLTKAFGLIRRDAAAASVKAAAAAAEAATQTDDARYAKNPLWGAF